MIYATVIIPTYKRPKETARCIELIAQSDFLGEKFDLEIIVVDSSPDELTNKSIGKIKDKLNINYIKLKNKTLPGEARNLAVLKAKNEIIINLDSDIEVKSDTIWSMINYLKQNPKVARVTGTSIFSSGEKRGLVDRPTKWDRKIKRDKTVFIEGIYGRYESFYKSAFLKINGYDLIFGVCGEGTDISVRFWRAGFPLGVDEKIVAYHNANAPESLRRADTDRMTSMYRSLFLVVYKYDVGDSKLSPHFIESHEERQSAYENATEFYCIVSATRSIDWFKENYEAVVKSKNQVPCEYDFKPFDIFTDKKKLNDCLDSAEERIAPFYQKAFGKL